MFASEGNELHERAVHRRRKELIHSRRDRLVINTRQAHVVQVTITLVASSMSSLGQSGFIVSSQDDDNEVTPSQLLLSSWIGAMVTSGIVTPLDVVKIRIQSQQKDFMKRKCFLYCNGLMEHLCYCNGNGHGTSLRNLHAYATIPPDHTWFKRPGHFNGTVDAFSKIIRNEGFASLWSGLSPTLLMALPSTMVYFTLYDSARSKLSRANGHNPRDPPLWISVFSGALARASAATVISPLELIRTKIQSQKLSYFQVGEAIRVSIQTQGLLSLWRGLGPTLLRDVPFSSIYWLNYEFYKKQFKQTDPTFLFSFAAGATAGTVAAVVTLPFDVVKTHRQIELGERELLKAEAGKILSRDSSTMHIMKRIHSQSGFSGLFSGLVPRIIKVAPACAIMISTYEFGKSFFRELNRSNQSLTQFILDKV